MLFRSDPGPLEVVLAAPFTALATMQGQLSATPFLLAAQDLFWENSGAYTGEVSATMLVDVGCTYVIVGHSERRQYFGETDETVSKKVAGPRLPKKVCDEPAPPKAAPMDWPFPTWSNTTRIKARHTVTWTITSNTYNTLTSSHT